jgi:hypothetical protein
VVGAWAATGGGLGAGSLGRVGGSGIVHPATAETNDKTSEKTADLAIYCFSVLKRNITYRPYYKTGRLC